MTTSAHRGRIKRRGYACGILTRAADEREPRGTSGSALDYDIANIQQVHMPEHAGRPKPRAKESTRSLVAAGAPLAWVPRRVFFTSGVGTHETQRVAVQR